MKPIRFRDKVRVKASALSASALVAVPCALFAQQVPDTSYASPVARPEFSAGPGPQVSIDAAHLNLHTSDSGYGAFARLLRADGYRVVTNHEPFTADGLAEVDVLVVANAMHSQSRDAFAPLPTLSAFTQEEIQAVEEWVHGGGSLLLIADHMPLAGHAEAMAAVFGVRFHNGFAMNRGPAPGRAIFRRSDGSLAPVVVVNGRDVSERVDSVVTFTGQAFRVDASADAEPILVFPAGYDVLMPQVAWEFSAETPRVSGDHLLQGVLLRHGAGRVVMLGEAAMFGAQLAGPQKVPVGMNSPEAPQNYRLALNIMHWLGGR